MKWAPVARDLGINYTAGLNKVMRGVRSDRFNKNKGRRLKIIKIARIARAARKLFSGSGYAASTWGHQIQTILPEQLSEIERHAASAAGIDTGGRCRFIALCCAYNNRGHPVARIIRDVFVSYFDVLREIT